MLRHAERVSVARLHRSGGYSEETLAVYVNLMALRYDAGPSEFYRHLMDRAVTVCADVFDDVRRASVDRVQVVTQQVADGSRRLFEHWMAHFSEDARVALKWIATQPISLRRGEVAQLLADGGRDRFGAERTWHELQYVGVSKVDGDGRLAKCNALFWRYYQEFEPGSVVETADELRIWDLIKETEIALRSLVYRKYGEKWPGREVTMMKRVLGEEWKGVER